MVRGQKSTTWAGNRFILPLVGKKKITQSQCHSLGNNAPTRPPAGSLLPGKEPLATPLSETQGLEGKMLSPEGHTAGSTERGNLGPGSNSKVLFSPSGRQMWLFQPHVCPRPQNRGLLPHPLHTPAQGFGPKTSPAPGLLAQLPLGPQPQGHVDPQFLLSVCLPGLLQLQHLPHKCFSLTHAEPGSLHTLVSKGTVLWPCPREMVT